MQNDINFDYMLHLLAASAFPIDVNLGPDADYKKIISYAKKNNCLSSVLDRLKSDEKYQKNEETKAYDQTYENLVYYNILRFNFFLYISNQCEKEGIKLILLKGDSVGCFYQSPHSRVSGDVDVLVSPEKAEQTLAILKKNGCEIISDITEDTHHYELKHPSYGIIELHIRLFRDKIKKMWFASDNKQLEIDITPYKQVTKDGEYYTLTPDSQMYFLFYHVLKHFIRGGISIRALLDLAVAYYAHKKEIDYNKFYKSICESGFETVYNTFIGFLSSCMNVPSDYLPNCKKIDSELIEAIYNDLIFGGWIGKDASYSEKTVKSFEKQRQTVTEAVETSHKYRFNILLKRIFPEKKDLKEYYCKSGDKHSLYTVIWLRRIGSFLEYKLFKKGRLYEKYKKLNQNDDYRINMLKKFDLISSNKN